MRKHRKEIKQEIKDYDKSRKCSDKFDNEESDSDTDENDIY